MKQPEALRIADDLLSLHGYPLSIKSAIELRRLHEANEVMLEALKELSTAGDVVAYGSALHNARAAIAKGEQS